MTTARVLLAAGLAALVALLGAAPAAAQNRAEGGGIGQEWVTPTVNLAWDGATYQTATQGFVGVPVAVPGDRAVRDLRVRNDGPSTGTLRAWVQQVDLLDLAGDDGFYDDLRLDWTTASTTGAASFRDLASAGSTQIAQVDLDAGASTVLSVGYAFPAASTTGNASAVGARAASFVVHLEIRGALATDETEPDPGQTPSPTPTPDAGGTDAADPGAGTSSGGGSGSDDVSDADASASHGTSGGAGSLAHTGANAVQMAVLAAVAVGLGGLLALAARRRERARSVDAGSVTSSGR